MDIYAPLAGRMGMQWMREELEDLAFRVVNPEARNSIMRRFLTLQKESGDVIPKITDDIEAVLAKHGISGDVYGRAKKPEVQEMVKDLLGLEKIPRPDDAADALALAITHAHYLPGL